MTVTSIAEPRQRHRDAIAVQLPMPISVNDIWKQRKRRIVRSDTYKAWLQEAGWELARQRPGTVAGPYHLWLDIERPRTGTYPDLGNLEKAVSDLLQTHGVIQNDKLADSIVLSWSDDPERVGCLVSLKKADRRQIWGSR